MNAIGRSWESFLHPKSGLDSVFVSIAMAVGLAALEVPLAVVLGVIAMVGPDCSQGGSLWAGTCPVSPIASIAMATLFGLMVAAAVLAGVAMARALILTGIELYRRLA